LSTAIQVVKDVEYRKLIDLVLNDTLLIVVDLWMNPPLYGVAAVLKSMKSMLTNESFEPDITFRFTNSKDIIRAHKNILMARSPVFRALYSSGLLEAVTNELLIDEIDPEVMKELLCYLYTSTFSRVSILVPWRELLIAASKYDIHDLAMECEWRLWTSMRPYNVKSILIAADKCNAVSMKRRCIKYAAANNCVKLLDDLHCGSSCSNDSSAFAEFTNRSGDSLETPEVKKQSINAGI
jgi:hypothetical protein